ncbi:NO-associated protein 1, chloroplastic/mitochondrial-like isoform X2 [Rosa chinensis]|uniref:NO-associated protein 1, chloroplastic/mitochondrial-like isoform X2 n=1 Tax=Rosa chinensis TaxID=74649 RepID=UPI001AD8D543|nr:NO-associated protein 1, chloroplastic/mitochondrial-like isoform X2 [Rosa chinensis]XP_040367451.1 NO-associated protein 1, chloroplastic/mitochondrial-like isoform X2 [Rosa chinensis]
MIFGFSIPAFPFCIVECRLILWTSMVDFWLGANPMILVITKVDLLAKGTDFNCIGDWVVEATVKKKLNVMSVHLTSSKSLVGVAGVALEIQKKKGRDVDVMVSFLVGILEVYLVLSYANVGK